MNKLTRLPSRCYPIISNMRLYSVDSGSAGSIRAAGGTFGKMEAANEEVYFNKQKLEQLADLKSGLTQEIIYHEEHIREHEKAIQRHKERVHQIDHRILPKEPFPS